MKVYVDSDFRCHMTPESSFREVETDFFDGRSKPFIEGYRFVPEGETWTREDGEVFHGQMISPAVDYDHIKELDNAYQSGVDSQDELIADLMNEIENLCNELIGV